MVDYVLIFALLQSFYGAVCTAVRDNKQTAAQKDMVKRRALDLVLAEDHCLSYSRGLLEVVMFR